MTKKMISIAALLLISIYVQAHSLPGPTGFFKVGTTSFELVDSDRLDLITSDPDDFRRVTVQAWYPARINDEEQAPHMTGVQKERIAGAFQITVDDLAILGPSNSYINASPVMWNNFPVVIFAHGFGGFENQNSVLMEELASHGYIVFALNYTHYSIVSTFNDGTVTSLQALEFTDQELKEAEEAKAEVLKNIKATDDPAEKRRLLTEYDSRLKVSREYGAIAQIWIDDTLFFIETLREKGFDASLPDSLRRAADLDRIGMFGHSFGGNVTTLISLMNCSPIKAGMNMDGTIYPPPFDSSKSEQKRVFNLKRPFLFLTQGREPVVYTLCDPYYLTSHDPVYRVKVDNTAHNNFCNLTYISALKDSSVIGTIEADQMTEIMKTTIVPFFDTYLKGVNNALEYSPLTNREDVVFESRNVKAHKGARAR